MAARTGAVAGINADYFDIGNTNQPLNVVVRDGALLRTPSKRAAFDVARDGSFGIGYVGFTGTVVRRRADSVDRCERVAAARRRGAAHAGLRRARRGARGRDRRDADAAGFGARVRPATYRVAAVGAPAPGPVTGTLLGFGPAAQATRAAAQRRRCGHARVRHHARRRGRRCAAVGGGPLLLAGGAAVDDPNSPAPGERDVRFPVAGAGARARRHPAARSPSTAAGPTSRSA